AQPEAPVVGRNLDAEHAEIDQPGEHLVADEVLRLDPGPVHVLAQVGGQPVEELLAAGVLLLVGLDTWPDQVGTEIAEVELLGEGLLGPLGLPRLLRDTARILLGDGRAGTHRRLLAISGTASMRYFPGSAQGKGRPCGHAASRRAQSGRSAKAGAARTAVRVRRDGRGFAGAAWPPARYRVDSCRSGGPSAPAGPPAPPWRGTPPPAARATWSRAGRGE